MHRDPMEVVNLKLIMSSAGLLTDTAAAAAVTACEQNDFSRELPLI